MGVKWNVVTLHRNKTRGYYVVLTNTCQRGKINFKIKYKLFTNKSIKLSRMKKIFTFAFALFATAAMNAQNVDTSNWNEGDDIAAYLNWGDYDGSWSGSKTANNNGDYSIDDMGDWWKGSKPSEWNEVDGTACVGYYFDGKQDVDKLTNVYQVVYFPAGFYTIKVQALYREGTPIDNFTNHFNKVIKKNAWLYADVLTSEDPESEVTTSYQTYIRSLATSEQTEGRLHTEEGSWKNDYQYDYKTKDPITNEDVVISYYCPCCLPGAIAYFAAGKYENELKIILNEGAYVRLGFRKTANITQDWLVFTNFRIIYNGEADADAKLELAGEQYDELYASVEEVRDNIDGKGYGALAGIVGDQLMEIDSDVDKSDYASVLAGIAKLNALAEDANNALLVAYSLADLIESSYDMLASTDFPGKDSFETELDKIEAKASTDDPEVIGNDVNAFNVMYEELSKARADYLNTGDADEHGAKDFTSLIKYPWFVNPEYTPTQNDDGTWTLKEETWQWGDVQGPGSYTDKKKREGQPDRTDIADKVVLSADETATNQWFKVFNQTSGWSPGLGLYYIGGLIGVSDGWNGGLIGTMEIRQQLVGLPKGYYSLKALLRGNGTDATNTWNENNLPPYHNIFAENSDEVRVASLPGHTDSFLSSNGWYEWNPNVWTEHKTGIISALDGRLLIGGQSSMVACYTGFRLLFYGENPDFSLMVQEEIDAVLSTMRSSNLTFAGDTLHVLNLLNSIQFPVTGDEAYKTSFATTNEAKEYIAQATQVMKSYTLASDYDKLYAKYTDPAADGYIDGPVQAAILEKPIEYVAMLGTEDGDTYKKVAPAKEIYNAYKSYLATYDQATAFDDPELKEMMNKQASILKAQYSNVATLNQFETQINFLVKKAAVIAAGGRNASESNPVEITSLINNPDFTNSASSGWSGNTGTSNEYARGNSEVWNTNPLDMYQVIKGLPAGKYELRVRALYRDARNVRDNSNQSWTSYWTDANGDVNAWERHYAELYARTINGNDTIESAAYVKSVCDGKFTEPSFTKYYRNNSSDLLEGDMIIDENGNETGEFETDTVWTISVPEDDLYDDDDEIITTWTDEEGKVYTVAPDGPDNRYVFQDENGIAKFAWQLANTYPFDERIKTSEGVFYYPSSMLGAYYRFNLSPEAYCNKIQITVPAGSDLRIGFRKDMSVSGDWVIYDDFQLFYLGGDLDEKPIEDAINDVVANKAKAPVIYNVAGQRINALQKGLNIVGGKKVYVK